MEQNMSTNFKTESQKFALAPTIREVKGVPRPRAKGFMLEVLKQVEHVHPEGWHYDPLTTHRVRMRASLANGNHMIMTFIKLYFLFYFYCIASILV